MKIRTKKKEKSDGGGDMSVDGAGNGNGVSTASISTATGATLYKDMTYAREAVEELVLAQGINAAAPTLRALLADLLEQLPVLVRAHGEMVRQAAADLAAEICLSLLLFKEE